MDLDLHRVDYLQVAVTGKNCMKVLPNNEKSKRILQKVVVADKSGVVTCFGSKKRDISNVFKTLPGEPNNFLDLGGALGTPQDKIFVASGSVVHGYSRKGKKFLGFDTNITENIKCICVSGSDLLIAGEYIYNHFCDCIDKGYYLSSDKINDIICIPVLRKEGDNFTPILACNDRLLRVLDGTELRYEIEVAGVPQCIVPYLGNGGEDGNEIIYGTVDGTIGHIVVGRDEPNHTWELPNDRNLGGVSCLAHHDMTGNGTPDLLVGREDGTVEVYSYDIGEEPTLRYSHTFNESITAIQGGVIGATGFDEIVLLTYSGWIIGLTTEPPTKHIGSSRSKSLSSSTNEQEDQENLQKINEIKSEIEELQMKVASERDKYRKRATQPVDKNELPTMSRAAIFHVKDRFVLSPSDSSYNLSIEVQTPIDHIVLQSDVPIDILDVAKNSAVVSYTPCTSGPPSSTGGNYSDVNSGNFLLATYRCQSSTTRLELKVRSIEGQYGLLRMYITPQLQPKTCIVREFVIKPLSLHQRSHFIDDNRPMNVLKLTGPFSLAEMHSWVAYSLPDVPDRTPTDDVATFSFVNTFLDTVLECTYKKGEGIFKSDNISTISILKDVLTKEATGRKINLNINYDFNQSSIPHTLSLIHPKLDYQLMLAKKVQLIDALKELQVHEGNIDFLAAEYQMILGDSEMLKEEFKKQPAHLERLYGMVTDLFIDKFKFKGVNVKQKVPQLLETLDNYDLSTLIEFFETATV
uniref:Bardet-Biedl syndrome 7 protein homolog isoform X1 n=1 Tax=Styela clava TaxID=7725 RepID=UPI00193A4512|nr:Bardet-Biedl syndrome 7 protein homolog isoform X1 [Styela clava]